MSPKMPESRELTPTVRLYKAFILTAWGVTMVILCVIAVVSATATSGPAWLELGEAIFVTLCARVAYRLA